MLEQVDQSIDRFQVADDTAAVTEQRVKLMGDFKIGGEQINDANIVAALLTYDIPCLLPTMPKTLSGSGRSYRLKVSITIDPGLRFA